MTWVSASLTKTVSRLYFKADGSNKLIWHHCFAAHNKEIHINLRIGYIPNDSQGTCNRYETCKFTLNDNSQVKCIPWDTFSTYFRDCCHTQQETHMAMS